MRIEIEGVQVTDAIVEVLALLQSNRDLVTMYTEAIDAVTRSKILADPYEEEEELPTMDLLRRLQMIRQDIITLAAPPDIDNPDNVTPKATF